MKRLIYTMLMAVLSSVFYAQDVRISNQSPTVELELPPSLKNAVQKIQYDMLGNEKGRSRIKVIDNNCLHIRFSFSPDQTLRQDDWQVAVTPGFIPSFHWAPHITPTERHVIEQHVFRSPALIASDEHHVITLIPDLDIMLQGTPVRWYLDMDVPGNRMVLGMNNSRVDNHVLFVKEPGASYPAQEVEIGFYLMVHEDKASITNPFRNSLKFLWSRWGHDLYKAGNPVDEKLEKYVEYTYNWAFNTWSENVWQEFTLNGKKVGAPVFIVNVTQSPNYPGEVNEREFRSIWNQAWFSSLRSASGLFRYARRTSSEVLMEKALLTKELALSFPQTNGFFPGLIATEMKEVEIAGQKYNRSKGWDTYYWGNSNRNPYTWNPAESPYHILDMSWTALLMLRWYDELEKDERLLDYTRKYAEALIEIQSSEGFFPGWIDRETLDPMQHLNESSESSLSATLLLKLHELTGEEHYKEAALKASFVMMYAPENPVTREQWEKVYPFFGEEDYGFMMENYGHGGRTSPEGEGMGEFTIYDWGNGAAAEAYNRILDNYGR